jgi:hypothetical protein
MLQPPEKSEFHARIFTKRASFAVQRAAEPGQGKAARLLTFRPIVQRLLGLGRNRPAFDGRLLGGYRRLRLEHLIGALPQLRNAEPNNRMAAIIATPACICWKIVVAPA